MRCARVSHVPGSELAIKNEFISTGAYVCILDPSIVYVIQRHVVQLHVQDNWRFILYSLLSSFLLRTQCDSKAPTRINIVPAVKTNHTNSTQSHHPSHAGNTEIFTSQDSCCIASSHRTIRSRFPEMLTGHCPLHRKPRTRAQNQVALV
jgi:hypothetical protein